MEPVLAVTLDGPTHSFCPWGIPLSASPSTPQGASVSLVAIVALGHCAAFVDRSLAGVAAPLLKANLGLSDAQLGLLDGPAFVLLYAIGMLASWPLANSQYRFRLLAGCIATWTLGMTIFALGRSLETLMAARALVGLGQSAYVPLALGLIVEYSTSQWRGRSVAAFTAAAAAGRSLALLLGGLVLTLLARWVPAVGFEHWRLLFLMMAAPNVSLIAMLLGRVEQPPTQRSSSAFFHPLLASVRQQPGPMGAYLCGASAAVLVIQTVGIWAPSVLHREHGLAVGTAALVFGLALLFAAPVGHLLAGTLVDKRGKRVTPLVVVASALLLTIPLLRAVPQASSATMACGLLALISLVGATAAVAALTGLPSVLPPPLREPGLRLFLVFVNLLGLGLGPFVAGLVSDGLGAGGRGLSTALYMVCASAAVAGVTAALCVRLDWSGGKAEVAP